MQLQSIQDKFQRFYKNLNSGRRLTWLYSQGHVEIACLFSNKRYQLIVNVAQTCILYLFNQVESIKCSEIKQRVGLSSDDFTAFMK